VDFQRDLSVIFNRLGDLALRLGDAAEARRRFEADLRIAEALAARDPENVNFQRDLAISHVKLAQAAEARGDMQEASNRFQIAAGLATTLQAWMPGDPDARQLLEAITGEVARLAGRAS
jgi:tetratricopeptide (TPR) repeat protein